MDEKVRLYEFNSVPLKVATRPEPGKVYYTSYGEGFRCVGENSKDFAFEKVHDSVLREGHLVEDLSTEVLRHLFWTLTKTELEKEHYGIKDTC
jgi:hypothetical protein